MYNIFKKLFSVFLLILINSVAIFAFLAIFFCFLLFFIFKLSGNPVYFISLHNIWFLILGIPPHVDTHQYFTTEILSLTVQAGTVMDFYCSSDSSLHYAVPLPRRSLCVMSGPARLIFFYSIIVILYLTA